MGALPGQVQPWGPCALFPCSRHRPEGSALLCPHHLPVTHQPPALAQAPSPASLHPCSWITTLRYSPSHNLFSPITNRSPSKPVKPPNPAQRKVQEHTGQPQGIPSLPHNMGMINVPLLLSILLLFNYHFCIVGVSGD